MVTWTNGICAFGSASWASKSPSYSSVEKVTVWCALGCNWHYWATLVRGCWWTPGNCDYRATHYSTEKKIHPGTEAEARSWHGYCDLSAGWSNTTLDQTFTRISPSLISWRQDHLPSYGPPWPAHFPDLIPSEYFMWAYLKDRVYANNSQIINALKNNIRTEIRRISHEMLDRVTTNLNVRVVTVIQRQGGQILHIITYWAVLAKWWCTRKKLIFSVRQSH